MWFCSSALWGTLLLHAVREFALPVLQLKRVSAERSESTAVMELVLAQLLVRPAMRSIWAAASARSSDRWDLCRVDSERLARAANARRSRRQLKMCRDRFSSDSAENIIGRAGAGNIFRRALVVKTALIEVDGLHGAQLLYQEWICPRTAPNPTMARKNRRICPRLRHNWSRARRATWN